MKDLILIMVLILQLFHLNSCSNNLDHVNENVINQFSIIATRGEGVPRIFDSVKKEDAPKAADKFFVYKFIISKKGKLTLIIGEGVVNENNIILEAQLNTKVVSLKKNDLNTILMCMNFLFIRGNYSSEIGCNDCWDIELNIKNVKRRFHDLPPDNIDGVLQNLLFDLVLKNSNVKLIYERC